MIPNDYKYLIEDGHFTEEQIRSKMKTYYILCENLNDMLLTQKPPACSW